MSRSAPSAIVAVRTHRARLLALAATLFALALVVVAVPATGRAAQPTPDATVVATTAANGKPTIVLVHGAFADSSGWNDVMSRLVAQGYPVLAFSNPLRAPTYDGEYLKQFLSSLSGPVVLVGHSYGGAVITNAATGNPNVKALVYIAAYAPAEGESVAAANSLGGGHATVTDHLILRDFPGAQPGDKDAYIDPSAFRRLFAQDLPRKVTRLMAATQRPGALGALITPSGPPAWTSIPSYYMVASQDRIIPPEAERAMAERASAYTVEVNTSHVPMMSKPGRVTRLILRASR